MSLIQLSLNFSSEFCLTALELINNGHLNNVLKTEFLFCLIYL